MASSTDEQTHGIVALSLACVPSSNATHQDIDPAHAVLLPPLVWTTWLLLTPEFQGKVVDKRTCHVNHAWAGGSVPPQFDAAVVSSEKAYVRIQIDHVNGQPRLQQGEPVQMNTQGVQFLADGRLAVGQGQRLRIGDVACEGSIADGWNYTELPGLDRLVVSCLNGSNEVRCFDTTSGNLLWKLDKADGTSISAPMASIVWGPKQDRLAIAQYHQPPRVIVATQSGEAEYSFGGGFEWKSLCGLCLVPGSHERALVSDNGTNLVLHEVNLRTREKLRIFGPFDGGKINSRALVRLLNRYVLLSDYSQAKGSLFLLK